MSKKKSSEFRVQGSKIRDSHLCNLRNLWMNLASALLHPQTTQIAQMSSAD
jgi:hypothetical protein